VTSRAKEAKACVAVKEKLPETLSRDGLKSSPLARTSQRYVIWPIGKFSLYPGNPRLHDDKIDKLAAAIKQFGFRVPVLVRSDGEVIDGAFRIKAAMRLGMKEIPALIVDGMSERQVKAFRLSVNRMAEEAEWDADALIKELEALRNGDDFDKLAELTAFDPVEIRDFLEAPEPDAEEPEEEGPVDILAAAGDDSEYLEGESPIVSYRDDVIFPGSGTMGLPEIRSDLLLEGPPPNTWIPGGKVKPPFMFCYNKDSNSGIDWKKTVVCFYTADKQFERVWTHTSQVVTRFKNLGIKGIVSPNFSVFIGWPKALRAYNIYRSRWFARYAQDAGFPVVVDICAGTALDLDYLLDGLPKRCPMSMELQSRYTIDEHANVVRVIKAVLDFKPRSLWIYAPQDRLEQFPMLRQKKVPVSFITPRMVKRREEVDHA